MENKILHIVVDDKFVDYAINQFMEQSKDSVFVLFSNTTELNYIKQKDQILIIPELKEDVDKFISSVALSCSVILHGFFSPWQEYFINTIPKEIKVAWMFWGGEIYSRRDAMCQFLLPKSRCLQTYFELKDFLKGLFKPNKPSFQITRKSFSRIQYCMTDIEGEYKFAEVYLNHPMTMLWYNYYSIEETLGDLVDQKANGNCILIGNSSTIENNFIEALSDISNVTQNFSKVIVPLAYGSNRLKSFMLNYGSKRIPGKFYPITHFMDRNEYNKMLLSCSTMIMNHLRPQAQGNIITALWLGIRVYMNKKSMVYEYFKRHNLIIFSLQDDLKNVPESFTCLNQEQIEHNRTILMSLYGRAHMQKAVEDIVGIL